MYCVHFVWRTTYALLLRCPTSFPSHEPSFHHPSYVVMPSEPLPRRWCVPGHCGLHRSDSALAFRSLEVKSICELSVPVRVERIALSIICRTNGKADRTHYASSAAASLGGFHAHGLPWVSIRVSLTQNKYLNICFRIWQWYISHSDGNSYSFA